MLTCVQESDRVSLRLLARTGAAESAWTLDADLLDEGVERVAARDLLFDGRRS